MPSSSSSHCYFLFGKSSTQMYKKKFKESKEFVHMLIIKKYHTPKSHSNLVSPERLFNLKSIIKCLKVLKCELHILIVCQFFFIIIFMMRKIIKVNCLKYFFDEPIIISSEDESWMNSKWFYNRNNKNRCKTEKCWKRFKFWTKVIFFFAKL